MDDSLRDLQAALTQATDRIMRAATTMAFWLADDDDLPVGAEMPSEKAVRLAIGEAYEAIAQISYIRLEISGQARLFEDDLK